MKEKQIKLAIMLKLCNEIVEKYASHVLRVSHKYTYLVFINHFKFDNDDITHHAKCSRYLFPKYIIWNPNLKTKTYMRMHYNANLQHFTVFFF